MAFETKDADPSPVTNRKHTQEAELLQWRHQDPQ